MQQPQTMHKLNEIYVCLENQTHFEMLTLYKNAVSHLILSWCAWNTFEIFMAHLFSLYQPFSNDF
jgi:hypothetical protein